MSSVGRDASNWNYPNCLDCGKRLGDYKAMRCGACARLAHWTAKRQAQIEAWNGSTHECRKCRRTLPTYEFCTSKGTRKNIHSYCRECRSEKTRLNRAGLSAGKKPGQPKRMSLRQVPNGIVCSDCKEVKQAVDFYEDPLGFIGLRSSCKACVVTPGRKEYARRQAQQAVKTGKLLRQPCEACGAEKVHAHHEDYDKPLDVQWLCPLHHKHLHMAKEGWITNG